MQDDKTIAFVNLFYVDPASDPFNISVSAVPPLPVAGSSYTVTCTVSKVNSGLLQQPAALWYNIDREIITSSAEIMLSTMNNDASAVATLFFPSLRTSHSAAFTCIGILESLGNTFTAEQSYTVSVNCMYEQCMIIKMYDFIEIILVMS